MSTVPSALLEFRAFRRTGRVSRVTDLGIDSHGPCAALGEVCELVSNDGERIEAEVVALHENRLTLMPYGPCKGLTIGAEVIALGTQPTIKAGEGLLGQVVDAFAQPLAGCMPQALTVDMALHPAPLNAMQREPVRQRLHTGVRAIDSLLPVGLGQRLGIFAGSGVGKSSLLGMLARNMSADVAVIALIGERGREVQEFLEQRLSPAARQKSVVVVATAEQPAVVRARAACTATSIAEYFRSRGKHVLLMMDSITRYAMARREIDLAAGQPPTSRGYTPSVFSAIPELCERCGGLKGQGSITALYTVLVEGDDVQEPVADALRATLDGHIVLSRDLANEGHYPSIDVLQSVSRLEGALLTRADHELALELRSLMAVHRRQREMVDMGLYKAGTNRRLDHALQAWEGITSFLRQRADEVTTADQGRQWLQRVLMQEATA